MQIFRAPCRRVLIAGAVLGVMSLPAAADVEICIAVDGSSTTSGFFNGQLEAIAAAISDPAVVPQDCGVAVAVLQWAGEEQVEIPMTEVTSGNASALANDVLDIESIGGITDLGTALSCVDTFSFNPGDEKSILVVTDGVIVIPPTIAAVEAVEDAGVDINVIRNNETDSGSPPEPVLEFIARPQPASTPPDPGWVIDSIGPDEFAVALATGFDALVPDDCPAGPPPEPEAIPALGSWALALLALLVAGLGARGYSARQRLRA